MPLLENIDKLIRLRSHSDTVMRQAHALAVVVADELQALKVPLANQHENIVKNTLLIRNGPVAGVNTLATAGEGKLEQIRKRAVKAGITTESIELQESGMKKSGAKKKPNSMKVWNRRVTLIRRIKPGKSSKTKAIKPGRPFSLFRDAEERLAKQIALVEKMAPRWIDRFGDRAIPLIENVTKILGAVQAAAGAGKNPLEIAPGKEDALLDVLAGAKALQQTGPGASMALKSYYTQAQSEKQGMTPEQAEVEALKYAGRSSAQTRDEVQNAMQRFQQAQQNGNEQEMNSIKAEFASLFQFYQNLLARIQGAQQQQGAQPPQQQPVQQQVQQGQQPPPVARPPQPAPAPAAGTPGGPRAPM